MQFVNSSELWRSDANMQHHFGKDQLSVRLWHFYAWSFLWWYSSSLRMSSCSVVIAFVINQVFVASGHMSEAGELFLWPWVVQWILSQNVKAPKISLHAIKSPAWTVDIRMDGFLLWCCICQILFLQSECHRRNWDLSDQAVLFFPLSSNFGKTVPTIASVLASTVRRHLHWRFNAPLHTLAVMNGYFK